MHYKFFANKIKYEIQNNIFIKISFGVLILHRRVLLLMLLRSSVLKN